MKEFQIIGPPGTGKTTFLSKQISHSVEEFGYENVIVTSLTRTAAAEIASKDIPIPDSNVGTLHSFCFRELGYPDIAEKYIGGWNRDNPDIRLSEISENGDDLMGSSGSDNSRDRIFQSINIKRAYMIPEERWLRSEREFFVRWKAWKNKSGFYDFTDLIEEGLRNLPAPDKKVLIADEVQDYSRLEMALLRKWGEAENMEKFIIAGDSDQLLYEWRGADPDLFKQEWVNESNRRILSQSYRIPKIIHDVAKNWIEQIAGREKIDYLPKEGDSGAVKKIDVNLSTISRLQEEIESYLEHGKKIMFLTTCGYMLIPVMEFLRKSGFLYYNPYRISRGDWNPVSRNGVSTLQRVKTLLYPNEDGYYSFYDVRIITEHWKAKELFKTGMKKKLHEGRLDENCIFDEYSYGTYLNEKGQEILYTKDLDKYKEAIIPSKIKSYEYPIQIAKMRGKSSLFEIPSIIIGTIHSVKGGEADVVYLFPDLSRLAAKNWQSQRGRDSIIRTFYVGMTRAREELKLCKPKDSCHVRWKGV